MHEYGTGQMDDGWTDREGRIIIHCTSAEQATSECVAK